MPQQLREIQVGIAVRSDCKKALIRDSDQGPLVSTAD
jgi:hypothetical protein